MFISRRLVATIFLILSASLAFAEVSPLTESEIEQRNAAAAFALTREAAIPALIGECGFLLKGTTIDVEATFRGWYDRNKSELETANTWLDRYMLDLEKRSPELRQRATDDLMRSVTAGALTTIRTMFKRQLPDQRSCEWAVNTYVVPQVDIKNIGKNPGSEQFREFGLTLDRIRNEPEYKAQTRMQIGFENAAMFRRGISNMATLDAAEAAKERGDGSARLEAFRSLVLRGDGSAAQAIGMMYFRGDLVEKSPIGAYYWFYTAWSLADYDGLNAMGVMLRDTDGTWINRDLPLAQAAFTLATVASRDKTTRDRAQSNANRLGSQIDAEGTRRVACFSLRSLDDELRQAIPKSMNFIPGKPIKNSEKKLGTLIPGLSAKFDPASCK